MFFLGRRPLHACIGARRRAARHAAMAADLTCRDCACTGFRQLKLVRGARSITCFVEFSDVTTAMAVHNSQQVCSLMCLPAQFLGSF